MSTETPHSAPQIETPPTTFWGILRRLGPGLIIAAAIVGSGELVATTKTGAEAGFTLLWLIIIGCVIKMFVQVEFGRYTITENRTTIDGLNSVPGPRFIVNWIVWCWLAMFVCTVGQLGGIVGGVGQALAMVAPFTGDYIEQINQPGVGLTQSLTYDDIYWSAIVTVVTSILLFNGRYGVIQTVATIMVVAFTLLTIFNVIALPAFSPIELGWRQLAEGLSFRLPTAAPDSDFRPVATALAAFGIIGVGASELVTYPYWCLEKGYARFTGPCEQTETWAHRANGWLRVMRWDAAVSMVIFTLSTVAFYLLGAAVLHPLGLSPSGSQMIATLSKLYQDVFQSWGNFVFLCGAFAVLYSTFFVATAGNSRIAADAIRAFGVGDDTPEANRRRVRILSTVFPFISFGIYLWNKNPVQLIMISGLAQALMLPILAGAGVYFRYRRCDPRIAPGRLWDVFLWLSFAGLLISGVWGAGAELKKFFS